MKTVILAEKPSQALAYAQSFKASKKKEGYFEISDPLFSGETYITFGFGHLVELAEPGYYDERWKTWSLDALPIFPNQFMFNVPKDKKKQFNIVAKLLKQADTIVIATDSDREGENIGWSIIKKAGAFSKTKTYKRLWINSLEKDVIYQGFKQLKPAEDYYPFYIEAQTRQISDWLLGMNGSVLYSLEMQKKGIRETFSLGRVQTPTLYMIYQRQIAIEMFKKEPYFDVEAMILTNQGQFKGRLNPLQTFKTKEAANAFLSRNGLSSKKEHGVISNVEKEKKKTKSPHLFSLSSLQSKINQMYQATANETLGAMQGLYEAKLLSYPRTDTPYITESEFQYLKENYQNYCSFLSIDEPLVQDKPRKRYVDSKKVQEHYAIIPTKQVPSKEQFEHLDLLQKNIYELVLKTTLAMFMSDYEYEETTIETNVSNLIFKTTGKVPVKLGWKKVFEKENSSKEEEQETTSILPQVSVGETVRVDIQISEKETKPPKPFTEGTLLTAMKTANKTVDNEEAIKILKEVEGIGTEATRASIIETLKQKKYIVSQKNKLTVTEKGKLLCKSVEAQPLLSSAEMTAKWESSLKRIGQKQSTQEHFLANIQKFILHLLENVPKDIARVDFSAFEQEQKQIEEKVNLGTCPKCKHGEVKKFNKLASCQNEACDFKIWTTLAQKKLSDTVLKELIEHGKTTKKVKGFKGKKRSFDANLKLENYLVVFDFDK